MAVYKCKMCGGDLAIIEGVSVAECENCGRTQTVPTADSEKKMTLFGRANRLRMACEFDKAAGVYESIVAEFPTESEAYWGLVLCKYGIEYVDDPATGKKVPTCHRSSFDSVMQDSDFEQACENADPIARRVYREEAKAIDLIQKGILEISGKEEPYDIFICYKETAEDGQRTVDSVIAQEVYDALTEKGYRVFFSRITLEDKLGTEYEPYIFAALNSAKVMLAFGTDYEHFNAVWVKNEWSRFLALIAAGQKKALIPCYKGIDAYDMPQEFAHLQGQDMGKVGAIQDLLRGIEKILPRKQEPMKETVVVQQAAGGPTADSLLKRGQLFLGDGDWTQADTYFDKVLDIDPENADAYVGKLCAAFRFKTLAQMAEGVEIEKLTADRNYQKAVTFGSKELKEKLDTYLASAWELKKAQTYQELCRQMESATTSDQYHKLANGFRTLGDYEDAKAKIEYCLEKAKYLESIQEMQHIENLSKDEYEKLIQFFAESSQPDAEKYHQKLLLQKERVLTLERKYVEVSQKEEQAKTAKEFGALENTFRSLKNYRDSAQKAKKYLDLRMECYYVEACRMQEEAHTAEEFLTVSKAFSKIMSSSGKYKDAPERHKYCYDNYRRLEEKAYKESRRTKLQAERSTLQAERSTLQAELPNIKGLFSGGKRRQIEAELSKIEAELSEIEAELNKL